MARTEQDKQMDRIAGLLERAEDENNSEQEREAAARMAEKLGAKYSIDFAVARMHSSQRSERDDQIVSREVKLPHKSGNVRDQGYIALMVELVHANSIWCVWLSDTITVYGPKFDVEFAITLFNVLVVDQETHAMRYAKKAKQEGSSRTQRELKDAFRYGYRRRVRWRIEDLREERMGEIDKQEGLDSGSTAIALRDRHAETQQMAEEVMERKNVQLKSDDEFYVSNADKKARSAGDSAGSTVKLFAETQIERGKREID